MKQILLIIVFLLPFCGFAQLNDNFLEPNVDSSYPWKGDLDKFRIDDGGGLWLDARHYKGEARLYLPISGFLANRWETKMGNQYKWTSQNHIKVCLWIDNPKRDEAGICYYLQLNSNKKLTLYCQIGNATPQAFLTGATTFGENEEISLRAETDEKGLFSLYSKRNREGEAEEWLSEGSVKINHADKPGYFMFLFEYTSEHSKDKYVSYVTIKNYTSQGEVPEEPDDPDDPESPTNPLERLRESQVSANELMVIFNQPVVLDYAYFELSDLGDVDEIYINETEQIVMLEWYEAMVYGKEYELRYWDVYDKQGNSYEGGYSFTSTEAAHKRDESQRGDILINEVMADPKGLTALPETEYVELYNASGRKLELKGWRFWYGTTEVVLPAYQLMPDGYLVLYRAGREIIVDGSSGDALGLSTFPANLANNGKALQLFDAFDNLIDEQSYAKATPAKSWERSEEEWYLSTDTKGGTPGAVNSPPEPEEPEKPEEPEEPEEPSEPEESEEPEEPEEPTDPEEPSEPEEPVEPVEPIEPVEFEFGALLINEVMADPNGLTALPTTEYIELYNNSDEELELKNWTLHYGTTQVVLDAYPLPVGGYMVVYRQGREIGVASGGHTMPLERFPANLANSGKELKLSDATGKAIDAITYPKAKAGISWERLEEEWYLSTDEKGGTPGAVNSTPAPPDPEEPEESEEPEEPEDPEEPEEPEEPEPIQIPVGAIRINEVMADPKGLTALPETEYVELYNCSDQDYSLKGASFVYGDREIVLEELLFPNDSYLLLFRKGRELVSDGEAILMPLEQFPANLANSGKELALMAADGSLIDAYNYPKATPGRAWERGEQEWHLSTDPRGGTPGAVNSPPEEEKPEEPEEPEPPVSTVAAGEILFNEILPNPNEGGSEYIELYNNSDQPLSLKGLTMTTRKSDGSYHTRFALEGTIEANNYLLLTRNPEGVTAFYRAERVIEQKIPILTNTSATLLLYRTADEEVIDELAYSSKWHAAAIKEEKGVALERIDPDKLNEASNWTSATAAAGYGTPGYQNSQYLKEKEDNTGIERPEYSPQTGLYSIAYYMNQPGYSCRASVYSTTGQRVAEIANNEWVGSSGTLIWDGTGREGTRLSQGVYILHILFTHPDGKTYTFKQAFLVYQ
ncbi:lamin tail domain-containing protein [Parabacteroides sp. OttesenSCG-928-N08]|nr:lamin tail domain-containing protein [Parabacteroides sp. OttesenSCG-928-N08]